MIVYVQGDLFTSPAEVLVNTVNTVGVMGKGIALEFKTFYPEMFAAYQQACESGALRIGTLMLYRDTRKSVLNLPTKRHWRSPSRVDDIDAGLKKFVASYEEYGISSIAFPQLGCGNGELDWESQVRPLMERYLSDLPIRVYIHLYDASGLLPEHHDRKSMKAWLRSEPESLPASEAWDDLIQVASRTEWLQEWSIAVAEQTVLEDIDVEPIEEVSVPAIRFSKHESLYLLTEADFAPLWRQLRTGGLLSNGSLPMATRTVSIPVLSLLEKLDYIEPALFRRQRSQRHRDEDSSKLEAGVKLVPRAAVAQRMLIGV